MNLSKDSIVGEIVADNYQSAKVFKAHAIDYCCNGNRSLDEVCKEKNLETALIITELNKMEQHSDASSPDFQSWDLDLLADYIEKKHHRYVLEKIPELKAHLDKIVDVHGEAHPELIEIKALFSASAIELKAHMMKEETIVFPYVRKMASKSEDQNRISTNISNPIHVMMKEHDNEGERFRLIAKLSNNYSPPIDACTTYKMTYAMLQEFENDLHKHIHLENNILFPKTIDSEKTLAHA